jgi:PHD/YefM family antitoxin component YafN of YafNO toxin-antitoxin module
MVEPKVFGVREILSSFRATLATARQTGEPVIIALRRRKPAGVLLGYETWLALKGQPSAQADTSTLRAEVAAERQRNSELAADLADARKQAEELSRDLAAVRRRVAELEAQLARPPTASQRGEAWGVESLPEPAHESSETWPSQTWGHTAWNAEASVESGWGQR